jgi:hypothetical protein
MSSDLDPAMVKSILALESDLFEAIQRWLLIHSSQT